MRTVFERETEGAVQEQIRMVSWQPPEGKLMMELPEGFREMEADRRESCYPLGNRPEIILEYEQEEAQITLQFFDRKMLREEVVAAAEQVRKTTEKTFVQYECMPVHLWEEGKNRVGWFLMGLKDRKQEHIKAVFSLKGCMTLLTVTYPEENKTKWNALCRLMFESIKECEDHGAGYKRGF